MRILFDHGTPSGIAAGLMGHAVTEAIDRGWDKISNGELCPHLDRVLLAVNAATAGSFAEVDIPLPPKKPFLGS